MKMIRELTDLEIVNIKYEFPGLSPMVDALQFARAVLDAAWIKQQSDVDVKTS